MPEIRRFQVNAKHRRHDPHMLALRTILTERRMQRQRWGVFVASLKAIRGRALDWDPQVTARSNQNVRRWIRATPVLHEWVLSDKCLVSPTRWPDEVLPAFRHRLIPSPFQITNVNMCYKYTTPHRLFMAHLVVLLYGMGLTPIQIAKGTDLTEDEVYRAMAFAVSEWQKIPQYVLWATATDFRKAMLPPFIRKMPTRPRGKFLAALMSNPFLADTLYCKQMLEHPAYLPYLIKGTPKKLRISPGCRVHRTKEAVDVKEEELKSRT